MNKDSENIEQSKDEAEEKSSIEIKDIKIETASSTEKDDDHPSGCCGSCS